MARMNHDGDPSTRMAYIVLNLDGEVLTDVRNPNDMMWTVPALLEEMQRGAVTFRNPYQIPARIAQNLDNTHSIYRVTILEDSKTADLNAVISATFIGQYTALDKPSVQDMMKSDDLWKLSHRVR